MSNLLYASENNKRPQVATLAETHTANSGSFICEGLDGWAGECSFVVYQIDDNGNPILGSETDWIGTRNNRTLQNLTITSGIDRDYPTNKTYIIATETAGARNKLINGLKNTLDNDGYLKGGIVSETKIADGAISTNKIKNGTISEAKIANNAITNSKLAAKAVKAENVDFKTFGFDYSTEEQATPYKWLNGKTIYRKLIKGSTLKIVNIGEFDEIVDMKVIIKTRQNEWRSIPWCYSAGSNVDGTWNAGYFIRQNGDLVFQFGNNIMQNLKEWVLIVEYTKPS